MLELVRYQKEEVKLAAGNEKVIYSSSCVWREEWKRKREMGQLTDMPAYSKVYSFDSYSNFRLLGSIGFDRNILQGYYDYKYKVEFDEVL